MTEVRIGHIPLIRQDNGNHGRGVRGVSSSAAGDTSEASTSVHHLNSIHEGDGDAVRAQSEWKDQRW